MCSMGIASTPQSFLIPFTLKKPNLNFIRSRTTVKTIYCSCQQQYSPTPRKNENKLAKLALIALAAGVLTLGSVDDASAAKSGGRVGGQAFRSSAPRPSAPRINNNSRLIDQE